MLLCLKWQEGTDYYFLQSQIWHLSQQQGKGTDSVELHFPIHLQIVSQLPNFPEIYENIFSKFTAKCLTVINEGYYLDKLVIIISRSKRSPLNIPTVLPV